jgi:hypothetical protein
MPSSVLSWRSRAAFTLAYRSGEAEAGQLLEALLRFGDCRSVRCIEVVTRVARPIHHDLPGHACAPSARIPDFRNELRHGFIGSARETTARSLHRHTRSGVGQTPSPKHRTVGATASPDGRDGRGGEVDRIGSPGLGFRQGLTYICSMFSMRRVALE